MKARFVLTEAYDILDKDNKLCPVVNIIDKETNKNYKLVLNNKNHTEYYITDGENEQIPEDNNLKMTIINKAAEFFRRNVYTDKKIYRRCYIKTLNPNDYKESLDFNKEKKHLYVKVECGVIYDNMQSKENQFFIRCTVWPKNMVEKTDYNILASGYLREFLDEVFPELKDITAMHMASLEGKPLSATSKAFLYAKKNYFKKLAEHLRTTRKISKQICAETIEGIQNNTITEEEFEKKFILPREKRWKKQAEDVINKYQLGIPRR